MLSPAGAVAAGGLYTATEFDIQALDSLRPSLVEMGRAVVHNDHRNGAVVLLMWAASWPTSTDAAMTMSPGACRCRSAGGRRTAGRPHSRRARLRAATPRRPAQLPGASAPTGDHRRTSTRRDFAACAVGDTAADARLPAVGCADMRCTRPTTPISVWVISPHCWTSVRPIRATCGDSGRNIGGHRGREQGGLMSSATVSRPRVAAAASCDAECLRASGLETSPTRDRGAAGRATGSPWRCYWRRR